MNTQTPSLLPCPFCGGQPVLMDLAGYEVLCECGANFCDLPSLESAINGWNRRTIERELSAAREEIASLLEAQAVAWRMVWCHNCKSPTPHEMSGADLVCVQCASVACTFHDCGGQQAGQCDVGRAFHEGPVAGPAAPAAPITPAALSASRIVCAALQNHAGKLVVGPRHYDATMMAQIHKESDTECWRSAEQGFIDQHGRFLTREEAWDIADGNGQIWRDRDWITGSLHSEHLY